MPKKPPRGETKAGRRSTQQGGKKSHIEYILQSDVDILKGVATYTVVEAYDVIGADGYGTYKNETVYNETFRLSEIDHHEKIRELRKKWGIKK